MSKVIGKARAGQKILPKVIHSSPLRVNIPAGLASPKPPLGSQLGQRNINVAKFCKEFNDRTAHIKEGVPLPCRVKVIGDGNYNLVIHHPPVTFFLKQAAGIQKGQMCKGDVAGKITLKHLYEIALLKSQDPPLALTSLEDVCKMVAGIARTCGIKIVRTLNPKEYEEFMQQREKEVQQRLEEARIARESKLLRAT